MATRGTLYRCHLCSFLFGGDGPQSEGIDSNWTKHLTPIGDREVYNGELVELSVQMDSTHPLTDTSKVRFDILEEDVLEDDYQLALCGPGASPRDPEFPRADRLMEFGVVVEPDTVDAALRQFKAQHPDDFTDYIVALKRIGPTTTTNHLVTWWTVQYSDDTGNAEYYFIVNIDDALEDQSNATIDVLNRPAPATPTDPPNQPASSARVVAQAPAETVVTPVTGQIDTGAAVPAPRVFARRVSDAPITPRGSVVEPPSIIPEDVVTTPPWYWTDRPRGSVTQDRVETNTGNLLKDKLVAMAPGFRAHINSTRYVKAFNYIRAIKWGFLLFGRRSFIVLESSPAAGRPSAYYVLRLEEDISAAYWRYPTPYMSYRGSNLFHTRFYLLIDWFTDAGRGHILRTVVTTDDLYFSPGSAYTDSQGRVQFTSLIGAEHFRQLREWNDPDSQIPPAVSFPYLFAEVERLGATDDGLEDAAKLLGELDANAFATLPLNKRGEYLDLLVRAWTFHDQEHAAIEIVKTTTSVDDLRALIGKIQLGGRMEQFLRDMSDVWSLFVAIGKSVQPAPSIDVFALLMKVFREEVFTHRIPAPGNIPIDVIRVRPDPETGEVTIDVVFIEQLEEACMAFLNFLSSSWDGIVMIFTKPGEILEAIGQLVKLIAMVEIATADRGVPIPEEMRREAREYIETVWNGISESIANGFKGMLILNEIVGENKILTQFQTRVRWALLWEILSWFVGIGEIGAALKTLRILGKVRAFARIIRVLRSPAQLARMERLALLVGRFHQIEHVEVLRYISHLPEPEIRRIARLIDDVPAGDLIGAQRLQSLELLIARNAQLGLAPHLDDLGARLKAFRSLERKVQTIAQDAAAQLSDNAIEAFQHLNSHPNLNAQQLQRLIDSIPDSNVESFMRAVLKLQDANILPNAGLEFLTNFAHHPRIATFLIDQGDDLTLFVRLLQRSGEDLRAMEHQLDALRKLEARTGRTGGDWNAFVQRLRANDAAAWDELLESRRVSNAVGNITTTQAHMALIEDAAYDLLRAAPAQRGAAEQALRQRLTNAGLGARADEIVTRTMNYRIVRQLDVATHLPNLTPAQRLLLESIDADGWAAIIAKSREQMPHFATNPTAATQNIAGTLREELTYLTRDFADSMSRARQKAAALKAQGIDIGEVSFMRSEGGQRFGRTTATPDFPGEPSQRSTAGTHELTDNFIGAVDSQGNLHVLEVVESKSISNVDDLFPSGAEDHLGQLLNDLERLEATSITVGGRVFDAGQIHVGRTRTEWFVAIPPDVPFPQAGVTRLRAMGPIDLVIVRHPMDNATIQNVMRRIMDVARVN